MRLSALLPERPADLRFTVQERPVRDKLRTIAVPSPALMHLQQRLKETLAKVFGDVYVIPSKNALVHSQNRHFFQLDLQDAYKSLNPQRLAGVLLWRHQGFGDYDEVAEFLATYCCVPGHGLAQGGPASQLLFEIYCRVTLDSPLGVLFPRPPAKGFEPIIYSRYIDDLTFSSNRPIPRALREKIKKIVRRAGFKVHPRKTISTDRSARAVKITGVRLTRKDFLLHEEFYRQLGNQLDLTLRGELLASSLPNLRGRIAWFKDFEGNVRGATRGRVVQELAQKIEACENLFPKSESPSRGKGRYHFPRSWLQELRAKLEIVPYIRSHLRYEWGPKATGLKCRCPFCNARGQSLTASPVKQTFHCFKCKKRGDVLAFAMYWYGWNFVTAAVQLAHKVDLALPPEYYRRFGKPKQLSLFKEQELPAAGAGQ